MRKIVTSLAAVGVLLAAIVLYMQFSVSNQLGGAVDRLEEVQMDVQRRGRGSGQVVGFGGVETERFVGESFDSWQARHLEAVRKFKAERDANRDAPSEEEGR